MCKILHNCWEIFIFTGVVFYINVSNNDDGDDDELFEKIPIYSKKVISSPPALCFPRNTDFMINGCYSMIFIHYLNLKVINLSFVSGDFIMGVFVSISKCNV